MTAKASDTSWIALHGSFHGGWCWHSLFSQIGHPALCPTFQGLDHMTPRADIGLTAHIAQVADILAAIDGPFNILAHSYAGMVVPGAIAASGGRPQHTVFLDAFIPEEGECAFDHLGPIAQDMRSTAHDGIMRPPPAQAFGIDDAALAAETDAHLRPMALITHEEKSPVSAQDVDMRICHFIRCTQFPGFASMQARAADLGWPVHMLDAGHDAMITHPADLAAMLTQITQLPAA